MLAHIDELRERGFSVFFYCTITSYGKDIEPGVPDYHQMINVFQKLSGKVGKDNLCWRYDPIFITEKYTIEHHIQKFEEMTKEIAPYTNFYIFSFVEMYKKLTTTFPELRGVREEEKTILLTEMGHIAQKYHLRLQTCGDEHDYTQYGIDRSGCITIPIMENAIGRELKGLKAKPTRKGCGCLPSNDIGAYNTCPNGCRYCYATKDPALAVKNYRRHDPSSPLLIGELQPGDELIEAKQVSFLKPFSQLTFDI